MSKFYNKPVIRRVIPITTGKEWLKRGNEMWIQSIMEPQQQCSARERRPSLSAAHTHNAKSAAASVGRGSVVMATTSRLTNPQQIHNKSAANRINAVWGYTTNVRRTFTTVAFYVRIQGAAKNTPLQKSHYFQNNLIFGGDFLEVILETFCH